MVLCYRILHTSDVSTAVPFYANGFAHRPKEIRKDKVYLYRADQCRFIGYADDVNWTNSPQISSHDTSISVSYKDSYIVLMKDGKRLIRRDVIFELYQDQPIILKNDPTDRDPSDPNQDSNYSSEQYLDFDRQLGQPIRDPHSIFSKSATIYINLPKDVYRQPDGKPVVVKLKKSLYGLKQAGELFYKLMRRILTTEGLDMKRCIHDMCVFTFFDDETNERVITVLWVDDIIDHIESKVTKMQNLGEITRYIGIDMVRDRVNHTLELTQVSFTKAVIEKLGPNLKSTNVPLNPYHD